MTAPQIQVKRGLRDVDLSRFRVFVSYKTEDHALADYVGRSLTGLGFCVDLLTPEAMAPRIESERLEERLAMRVFHADAVCLVVSRRSLQSPWVQFEFRETAQSIGRIIFVCSDEALPAGDQLMAAINPGDFSQALEVSHTTVFVDQTGNGLRTLVDALLNDPRVGWFDGRSDIEPYPPTRGVEFKLESIRRRFARTYIMAEEAYKGRKILDVIPLAWSEIGCQPDDVLGAVRWAIFGCGRRHLATGLLHDRLEVFHGTMPFQIWHEAIMFKETGQRPTHHVDALDMLVVCDAEASGQKLGRLPDGRRAVVWALRPTDLRAPEMMVRTVYPGREIAGIAARYRLNRPAMEGLDTRDYCLVMLQSDRPDLLERVNRDDAECFFDTFLDPVHGNWIATATVLQ